MRLILRDRFWVVLYHLCAWSNFNFLHNSRWIRLPTHLCSVLYSLWCLFSPFANFVIDHFLSILTLTELVLIVLFSAAIRRDSVSLLSVLFLSHVFTCEILLVCHLKCRHSYLSFHFCFLIIFVLLLFLLFVLSLVALIGLPPHFLV